MKQSNKQILLSGAALSTLFPAAPRAREQAKQESEEVQRMAVGCGRNIYAHFLKSPLVGPLLKMSVTSSTWGSIKFSMIWTVSAISHNRLLFQLRPSARSTIEIEFGSLVLKKTHMIPTPTASDYIERKCTNIGPTAGELNFETNKSVSLDRWFRKAYGMALTPEFSELLMGYPIGWTELDPSEMPSARISRSKSLKRSK